jgi:hypothetical protein
MTMPLNSLLRSCGKRVSVFSHHSLMLEMLLQSTCCGREKLSQARIVFQTSWAKGQVRHRWSPNSIGPLHRAQDGWCGHPRRARLSAVRSLFWMSTQAKNLHLFSVLARQMRLICGWCRNPRIGLCRLSWRSRDRAVSISRLKCPLHPAASSPVGS